MYYLLCDEPESADNNFYYYSENDDEYMEVWQSHQLTGRRRQFLLHLIWRQNWIGDVTRFPELGLGLEHPFLVLVKFFE